MGITITLSYTMLAFHQYGFSSGLGDRIPVPVKQRRFTLIIVLTENMKA